MFSGGDLTIAQDIARHLDALRPLAGSGAEKLDAVGLLARFEGRRIDEIPRGSEYDAAREAANFFDRDFDQTFHLDKDFFDFVNKCPSGEDYCRNGRIEFETAEEYRRMIQGSKLQFSKSGSITRRYVKSGDNYETIVRFDRGVLVLEGRVFNRTGRPDASYRVKMETGKYFDNAGYRLGAIDLNLDFSDVTYDKDLYRHFIYDSLRRDMLDMLCFEDSGTKTKGDPGDLAVARAVVASALRLECPVRPGLPSF